MMLSQDEAPLRSTFHFLNTDDCRGKRAVQARAAKRGMGRPGTTPGFVGVAMIALFVVKK